MNSTENSELLQQKQNTEAHDKVQHDNDLKTGKTNIGEAEEN